MRRARWWFCLVALAGCGGDDPAGTSSPYVVRVTVSPTIIDLTKGASAQLTFRADAASGDEINGVTPKWSSSKSSIASVSNTGRVTAISNGTAIITAVLGSQRAIASVTVRSFAANLAITPIVITLLTGETRAVKLTASDSTGGVIPNLPAVWSSSAPDVAVVNGAGTSVAVAAKAPGTATITVSADGKQASANVTVGLMASLGGTWDWIQSTFDAATSRTCVDTGTVVIAQSGTTLTGSSEQTGRCSFGVINDAKPGTVANGLMSIGKMVFALTFTNGNPACLYEANLAETTPATLSGTVRCGNAIGAWQASRDVPITQVLLTKATDSDTLVRGETTQLNAELRNAAGRRAFKRAVTWATTNSQIAALVSNGASATVTGGTADGVASTTATSGSASASFSWTVVSVVYTTIGVGAWRTCAGTQAGSIYCWTQTPSRLFAGPSLTALSMGFYNGCGIVTGGTVHCWQGSDPTGGSNTIPALTGPLGFTSISTGGYLTFQYYYYYDPYTHTCAIVADGTGYCWGNNVYGQLGTATTANSVAPAQVSTSVKFAMISAGGTHTCGVTTDNRVFCWGANVYGQLGNGTTTNSSTPVEVIAPGMSFVEVRASGLHTCALSTTGQAWCWGSNTDARLGTTSPIQSSVPIPVSGGLTFASIAAGASHTCGMTNGGAVYCWGSNRANQFATGGGVFAAPRQVNGSISFVSITSGSTASHICGFATDQRAYCIGSPGMLGGGPSSSVGPMRVLGQR